MSRLRQLAITAVAILGVVMAVIQFIPSPPVLMPAALPEAQREQHRLLAFEGIANFRDLGGYETLDGRRLKWGQLYRAGTLAEASRSDLQALTQLNLHALVDFRSEGEKDEEPNRLPEHYEFQLIEIPTLDDGNKAMVGEIMERIETGDFDGFDPDQFMITANRQFATEFVPQFRQFMHTVIDAQGAPLLWHCSAGKDRTGFAAAILLRTLGVPQEQIMADYMRSKTLALEARRNQLRMIRLFKGGEAAAKLGVMMGVETHWLQAAFDAIDQQWGDFDHYRRNALQITDAQRVQLQQQLLEAGPVLPTPHS